MKTYSFKEAVEMTEGDCGWDKCYVKNCPDCQRRLLLRVALNRLKNPPTYDAGSHDQVLFDELTAPFEVED